MSVAEQSYRAVLAVVSDGETVKDVAAAVGVCAAGSATLVQQRGEPQRLQARLSG
ncbi:MAG: hypothetical protein M3Q17_05890 [Actinomycetota bacterium]|nr:hypothetical protein [Actinomycetota bacterium]